MLQRLLNRRDAQKQKGFTIIEVMIVLAIAGLILAVVLVAIPQLQKNQRNEARKSVLARISAEVQNYVSNNEGAVPTASITTTNGFGSTTKGFWYRYVVGGPAGTFDKPDGGSYTPLLWGGVTGETVGKDVIKYKAGGVCVGELPSGSGNARNFAIAVGLEGGASFCVDNQ